MPNYYVSTQHYPNCFPHSLSHITGIATSTTQVSCLPPLLSSSPSACAAPAAAACPFWLAMVSITIPAYLFSKVFSLQAVDPVPLWQEGCRCRSAAAATLARGGTRGCLRQLFTNCMQWLQTQCCYARTAGAPSHQSEHQPGPASFFWANGHMPIRAGRTPRLHLTRFVRERYILQVGMCSVPCHLQFPGSLINP